MADNSIDFVVTDPPYGIKFMNKQWDHGIPGVDFWSEMLRICKPGSMLAAFGGTRTYHRLTCAIEDAGWRIMDCMMFLHGQGFPKAMNFGKKIGGKWEGYSSCGLKPAWEPIILAMKPLDGTFAQNAEKWGVAGINVDESRIYMKEQDFKAYEKKELSFKNTEGQTSTFLSSPLIRKIETKGRWPANLILDESSAQALDQMTGVSKSSDKARHNNGKSAGRYGKMNPVESKGFNDSGGSSRFFKIIKDEPQNRFLYCAKASSAERQGSKHPTIKPKKLISYIVKLLAPPCDSVCLDPFMGSGTCGVACKELGVRFTGIELEKEYFEDAKRRIDNAAEELEHRKLKI